MYVKIAKFLMHTTTTLPGLRPVKKYTAFSRRASSSGCHLPKDTNTQPFSKLEQELINDRQAGRHLYPRSLSHLDQIGQINRVQIIQYQL